MGRVSTGSSPGRWPRIRIVIPPRSTKICGAPRAIVGGNRRAEHLDIPIGRGLWILADDVHVIKFERRIAHLTASRLYLAPTGSLRRNPVRRAAPAAMN